MESIVENWDKYLAGFFAILGVFSAVAAITPNESDNKILDSIWKIINKIGLRGPTAPPPSA